MKKIFLGPLQHWLILITVIGLGWLAGNARLHVTNFNLFLILLCIGTIAILFLVMFTTRSGEQVTREVIEEADSVEPNNA